MDKSTLKSILPLVITTAAALSPAPAQSGIYMDVETGLIKGDSQRTFHVNQIDILSWGWGVSYDQASAAANMQAITVVKQLDSSTGPIIDAVINNTSFKDIIIYSDANGAQTHCDFLEVKMKGASFNSSSVGFDPSNSDIPSESYTLDFKEVCLTVRQYDVQGECVVVQPEKCYVK